MIYDCFTFFNELEMLEFRLEELSDKIDRFVLCESTRTFSGSEKELLFLKNKARFSRWNDRIIHIIVDDMPMNGNAWDREHHQRRSIARALMSVNQNDVILISDVDEIPNKEVIGKVGFYHQYLSYYYVNVRNQRLWSGTCCILGEHFRQNMDIQYYRELTFKYSYPQVINGGWHFSFLMPPELISLKLKSYAHQEHNQIRFTSPEEIKAKIINIQDIADRPTEKFAKVMIDDSFPKTLLNNLKKYSHWILE
jgi:beta-1,4-mannosyl-glycoprotein beta-1,4-N-acetylglucosaminyltransferase